MKINDATRSFALGRDEGEALWWTGELATIKATGEETDGRYALIEVLAPEGVPIPLHVHHKEDETFYLVEGEMTFYVGEETVKVGPGSFVFGPKDVPHTYTVDSGPARLLFLFTPAGFEGFVREVGVPAEELRLPPPEARPDEDAMEWFMAIADRYGAELLGPPPSQ